MLAFFLSPQMQSICNPVYKDLIIYTLSKSSNCISLFLKPEAVDLSTCFDAIKNYDAQVWHLKSSVFILNLYCELEFKL